MWLRLRSSVKFEVFVSDFDKEISLTCRVSIGKLVLASLSSIK